MLLFINIILTIIFLLTLCRVVGLPGLGKNSVSCDVNPESCEEIDESLIGPNAFDWLTWL